jgi:hypothetical protein
MFSDPQRWQGNQVMDCSIVWKNHQEMPGTLLSVCMMIEKKVWKRKVSLVGQLVVGISGAAVGQAFSQTVGLSVFIKVIHQ